MGPVRRKQTHEELSRFRAAMDMCGDAIYLVDRTAMRFVDVNQTACARMGYSREELLQIGPQDLLTISREEIERLYDEVIAAGANGTTTESSARTKDGRKSVTELHRRALRTDEGWIIVSIARDITERKRLEQALLESEARFRSLTELSSDWYWEQDAELRFVATQGVTDARGGITPAAHIGKRRWELPGTDVVQQTWDEHMAVLVERKPFRNLLLRRMASAGEVHFIAVAGKPIFDAHGTFCGYRGVASDVTARFRVEEALRQANEQLEQLALHDPLTGLANRRKLAERFEYDMARSVRARTPLSLLMVDIDHFKAINDRHGHLAGDVCLKALAALLAGSVREVDLVVRFGGEEFVALLPESSVAQSLEVAERMRCAVEEKPIGIGDGAPPVAVTVSVGAAASTGAALPLEELIARADEAVYRAKHAGRNQVCVEAART